MFNNHKDTFVQKYFTYVGTAPLQSSIMCIVLPIFCNVNIIPLFILYVLCVSLSIVLFYFIYSSTYGIWESLKFLIDSKTLSIEDINKNRMHLLVINCITAIILGIIAGKFVEMSSQDNNYGVLYAISFVCLIIPAILKDYIDRYIYGFINHFLDLILLKNNYSVEDVSKVIFEKIIKLDFIRRLTTVSETIICIIPIVIFLYYYVVMR